MNQILNSKNKNKRIKIIFKLQFIFSIILVIICIIILFNNLKCKEKENIISKTISINAKLSSLYSANYNKSNKEPSMYFGEIICDKIKLDSFIFEQYSLERLKILPCKFSGGQLGDNGNICIIGHNYFDDRFFSNLYKLDNGDIITVKNLEGKKYNFEVFLKDEISEKDVSEVIEQRYQQELTLCTCTKNKEKRLIVKAKYFYE